MLTAVAGSARKSVLAGAFVASLSLMAAGCATGAGATSSSTDIASGDLVTIGAVEPILLVNEGVTLDARIDTGATTCSLDARDIKNIELDGEPWVRFQVVDRGSDLQTEVSRPVTRTTTIKRHGAPNSVRPVVTMELVLGSVHTEVEFTLTNRSKFDFPILVGRNLLEGRFVVDVAREHSTRPKRPGN